MKEILLLFLTLVSFSFATSTEANKLLSDIKQISQSKFGEYFANLVELQMEKGEKVQQVIDMVQKMLDDLNKDQAMDDKDYAEKNAKFERSITDLETNLEQLNNEQETTQQSIKDLSEDIAALSQTVQSLKKQLTNLQSREQSIIDAREEEKEEFKKKNEIQNKNLGAIVEILETLTNGVLDQKGAVLLEAKQKEMSQKIKQHLGQKHPLAIMIDMTAEFDEGTIKRVIERLERLKEGMEQQIQDEQEKQTASLQKYEVMLHQVLDIRSQQGQDYEIVRAQVNQKQNELIVLRTRGEELRKDIEKTQVILNQTRKQQEVYNSNYHARTRERFIAVTLKYYVRAEEIEVVKMALNLIQSYS